MIHTVTDAQIADFYRRRWVPEAPGHYHGPTAWATWDGHTAHFARQPGVSELGPEILADGEFAAFLMSLAIPRAEEVAAEGMAAFARWQAAGIPLVDEPARQARHSQCLACDFHDPFAWLGLGKCNHINRGCACLKWWLPAERCPANRWPA